MRIYRDCQGIGRDYTRTKCRVGSIPPKAGDNCPVLGTIYDDFPMTELNLEKDDNIVSREIPTQDLLIAKIAETGAKARKHDRENMRNERLADDAFEYLPASKITERLNYSRACALAVADYLDAMSQSSITAVSTNELYGGNSALNPVNQIDRQIWAVCAATLRNPGQSNALDILLVSALCNERSRILFTHIAQKNKSTIDQELMTHCSIAYLRAASYTKTIAKRAGILGKNYELLMQRGLHISLNRDSLVGIIMP